MNVAFVEKNILARLRGDEFVIYLDLHNVAGDLAATVRLIFGVASTELEVVLARRPVSGLPGDEEGTQQHLRHLRRLAAAMFVLGAHQGGIL